MGPTSIHKTLWDCSQEYLFTLELYLKLIYFYGFVLLWYYRILGIMSFGSSKFQLTSNKMTVQSSIPNSPPPRDPQTHLYLFWVIQSPSSYHFWKQSPHLSSWNYMYAAEVNLRKILDYTFTVPLWHKDMVLMFWIIWVCICEYTNILTYWHIWICPWLFFIYLFFYLSVLSLSILSLYSFNVFQIKSSTSCLALFVQSFECIFKNCCGWSKSTCTVEFVLKDEPLKTILHVVPVKVFSPYINSAYWSRHL